jgi:hypothetical protein
MSGFKLAGEGDTGVTVCYIGEVESRPSLLPNDDLAADVTGSVSRSRVSTSTGSIPYSQQQRQVSRTIQPTQKRAQRLPEARYAIRRLWTDAYRKTTEMVAASMSRDLIELSNAASDVDQLLDEMWSLRDCREIEWRGVLDFLQGVLRYTWKVEGGYEVLTSKKCEAIQRIVKDYLGPSTMDSESVGDALAVLEKAGFDPWIGISENVEMNERQ